jgi:hypothetical protein
MRARYTQFSSLFRVKTLVVMLTVAIASGCSNVASPTSTPPIRLISTDLTVSGTLLGPLSLVSADRACQATPSSGQLSGIGFRGVFRVRGIGDSWLLNFFASTPRGPGTYGGSQIASVLFESSIYDDNVSLDDYNAMSLPGSTFSLLNDSKTLTLDLTLMGSSASAHGKVVRITGTVTCDVLNRRAMGH